MPKEYSNEDGGGNIDLNTLGRSNNGQCLPVIIGGMYFIGRDLGDTNFIEVQVSVKTVGAYTISTQTINGYSFGATGNFADTGVALIRLMGTGKPIATGANTFIISLGATNCTVTINVQTPPIGAANYALEGDPAACVSPVISGVFIKNIVLDTTNEITINVNVITTGSYAISTNMVNGYSFSDAGFFTTTGPQTITLKGTGTPVIEGIDQFTITANVTSCSFSCPVTSGYVAVSNNDYFPLTYQSNWTYTDLWNTGFTVKRDVTDSVMMGGMLYKIMSEQNLPQGNNQQFYRKNNSDYYEYTPIDKYTYALKYTTQINRDLLFLKEDCVTGTTWESPEDTGQISGGQPVLIKYIFRCVAGNVGKTIQGISYQNVLVIQMRPQVRSLTDPWSDTGETTDLYYAKGIGLIYTLTIVNSFTKSHWELSNYLVN